MTGGKSFDVAAGGILAVSYFVGAHDKLSVDPDVETAIVLTGSVEPNILSDGGPIASSKLPRPSTDTQTPIAATDGFWWCGA